MVIDTSAIFCFAMGMLACMIISILVQKDEWRKRHELEYKVKRLYEHLACGKGYLGCNGGPKCPWDHK